jgi:hypothetical protein
MRAGDRYGRSISNPISKLADALRHLAAYTAMWSRMTNVVELDSKAGYAASKGLPAPAVFVTLPSLLLVAGDISLEGGHEITLYLGLPSGHARSQCTAGRTFAPDVI